VELSLVTNGVPRWSGSLGGSQFSKLTSLGRSPRVIPHPADGQGAAVWEKAEKPKNQFHRSHIMPYDFGLLLIVAIPMLMIWAALSQRIHSKRGS
jgi:hypothetical protein